MYSCYIACYISCYIVYMLNSILYISITHHITCSSPPLPLPCLQLDYHNPMLAGINDVASMMLHVFAWSFINQDNNRDSWLWLFAQAVSNQANFNHLLRQSPQSARAGCAATSNQWWWLLPVQQQQNAAARREATLLCPQHHCPQCPAKAADHKDHKGPQGTDAGNVVDVAG